MGQTTSRAVRKVVSPVYNYWYGENSGQYNEQQDSFNCQGWKLAVTPFVYKRKSSLYVDEDGDCAHEFYEEVTYEDEVNDECIFKTTMRRIWHHLTPLGYVDLPHPCINYELPIILAENFPER